MNKIWQWICRHEKLIKISFAVTIPTFLALVIGGFGSEITFTAGIIYGQFLIWYFDY